MAVRKAVLDCEVSTDDKTGLFQAFLNGGYPCGLRSQCLTMQKTDHRIRCLLRIPGVRPHGRHSNDSNEFAPPHSTLSSPMTGSEYQMISLIALWQLLRRDEPRLPGLSSPTRTGGGRPPQFPQIV